MKQLALLLLASLALGSCRKDRTCECTVTSGNFSVSNESVIKDTKRKARKACEKGSGTKGYATTTCVIKM